MGWEQSITFAFIGSALVVAYIASCIKEIDDSIHWSRFLPLGLRTILYFVSLGLLLFAIGVQTPIMMENGMYVNESAANAVTLLQNNIIGGVSVVGKTFYILIFIIIIISILLVIERLLLKRNNKDKEHERDYEQY